MRDARLSSTPSLLLEDVDEKVHCGPCEVAEGGTGAATCCGRGCALDRVKQYWDFDEHGQRLKMIPGWEKAEAEHKRIQGIREKSENDLKVSRIPYSIE